MAKLVGQTIYFGDVLGKHSDIAVDIEESMFTVKTDDQAFLDKFVEIMGEGTISGLNPYDYVDEDDLEDN